MKLSLSLFVMLGLAWWLLSGHADPLLIGLGLASTGFTVRTHRRLASFDVRDTHRDAGDHFQQPALLRGFRRGARL